MNNELIVQHFFENLGYHVEKIPEGKLKSPDFLITDNDSSFIVELKTKFPRLEDRRNRDQVLGSGDIYKIHEDISRRNTLSGIIKKAGLQLSQIDKKQFLRVVWLQATDYMAELRMAQFEATLYGLTRIIFDEKEPQVKDCYFFHNSEFYRYRHTIDGAIVSTETQAKLLLNPLSPRYLGIEESSLRKHFGNAVVNPINLESEGKAFIVESDIDRLDCESVLSYLCTKYKIDNAMNLPTNYLSGTMTIPDIFSNPL